MNTGFWCGGTWKSVLESGDNFKWLKKIKNKKKLYYVKYYSLGHRNITSSKFYFYIDYFPGVLQIRFIDSKKESLKKCFFFY